VRRRDFIALAGGLTATWPLAARAQQDNRVRHIGVFMNLPEGDPDGTHWIAALLKSLDEFGWTEGRNIRLDFRWGIDAARVQKNAEELIALNPEVIVAASPPAVLALKQTTRTVPIVFVAVTDPVALGLVESLARPGGNATGFSPSEIDLSAKWVQALKEMVPALTRIAVFQNPANLGGIPQFSAVKTAADSLGVALSIIDVRDRSALEQAVANFASQQNGGLVTLRITENVALRDSLVALAAKYRLPAIYPLRVFATGGGLASYGPDIAEEYREAGGYVDRILRGEKPANLPVQVASKFQLVINLKTAKSLNLAIPQTLLATADEVLE
jgi:putative tryptophan/tyrosine transport system substrate-binding protein